MKGYQLQAKGLSKRFGARWIFRDWSIEVSSGDILVLTGANGSGKSTLLKVLSGAVPTLEGELILRRPDGKKIAVEALWEYIAMAAPYQELIEEMTLIEMLDFYFDLVPARQTVPRSYWPEWMQLAGHEKKQIVSFSSGMKQRLRLAMAFLADRPVLLLDEPTSNLDERGKAWYQEKLSAVSREQIVVIASNDVQEYRFDGYEPTHLHDMGLIK